MSRGQFLAGGAASAVAAVFGQLRPSQAAATTVDAGRIDVHSHAITPQLEAILHGRGSRMLDGVLLPTWSPEAALAFQDRQGLDLQLLSCPDPALSLAARSDAVEVARLLNDELASIVRERPTRFGSLAVLPLAAGASAAIAELVRAVTRLGVEGVILPTNVDGRGLADDAFLPLLSELSRRRIPALVHPAAPRPEDWPEQQSVPADVLEHAFETVRCAAQMLYRGTFLRAPYLRLVFASGGGGLPFVSGRVAIVDQAFHSDLTITPLRRLSFDTAQSTSPGALAAMRDFVAGPRQIAYGSDWPLVANPPAPREAFGALNDAELSDVMGGAARARFPRLATRATIGA